MMPTVFGMPVGPPRSSKRKIWDPIVVINTFKNEDEATAKAHDSKYGLYASMFTQDINRAICIVKALECGTVRVDCGSPSKADGFPLGGTRQAVLDEKADRIT